MRDMGQHNSDLKGIFLCECSSNSKCVNVECVVCENNIKFHDECCHDMYIKTAETLIMNILTGRDLGQ